MKRTFGAIVVALILLMAGTGWAGNEIGSTTWFGELADHAAGGSNNSYFGQNAGYSDNSGSYNSFFGQAAGYSNTSACCGTFIGRWAGYSNTTGSNNTFIGNLSGFNNSGHDNVFVGFEAGYNNTTANYNSFFGTNVGYSNTAGSYNSLFGYNAGQSNKTETYNSLFGYQADIQAGISNATAIGSLALVTQSNSLVLGSINGVNGATADTNVGIGTTAPGYKLTVAGDINIEGNGVIRTGGKQVFNTGASSSNVSVGPDSGGISGSYNSFFGSLAGNVNTGSYNSFFGRRAGQVNTNGSDNSFFGHQAGSENNTGFNNSFFGHNTGLSNTTGSYNTFIGQNAGYSNIDQNNNTLVGASSDVAVGITNATAIGYQAKVSQSNSLVLGSINGVNSATADTNVGIGTTTPTERLQVVGNVKVSGNILLGVALQVGIPDYVFESGYFLLS